MKRAARYVTGRIKVRKIKLNEAKSTHVDFTNINVRHLPIIMNGNYVSYENITKYLGMILGYKTVPESTRKEKTRKGRNSPLSIHNKVLLYKPDFGQSSVGMCHPSSNFVPKKKHLSIISHISPCLALISHPIYYSLFYHCLI